MVEKIPGYNSLVKPLHFGQALLASLKYDRPAKGLRVIAVTGTNGKTTTCFMIWKMLNRAGRRAGILSTVGWGGVGLVDNVPSSASADARLAHRTLSTVRSDAPASLNMAHSEQDLDATVLHSQVEHMTTERVGVLNQRMRAIADAKAEFLVLEVTSHALCQFRTLGVPIEVAVFTNITPEHLDYHKTFEKYRSAKLKLFKKSKYGIVNADDKNAQYFINQYSSGDIITYGIEGGDLRAMEVELSPTGVKYSCGDIKSGKKIEIKTQIPGKFNVYNSLAAVAVGKKVGLTDQQIKDGIYALEAVEGRMTRVREGQKFEVIVDYAHQPDALQKVFDSVQADGKKRRIISVHGGAGRRDHSTRKVRGEILGRESDIVIITEDDTRDEDPKEIARQFVQGALDAGKILNQDLFVNLDRESAIRQAIELAEDGDLVLILGKGHEKTILRGDGAHPFEDIKVAQKILREKVKRSK